MPIETRKSGFMSSLTKSGATIVPEAAEIHSLSEDLQNMSLADNDEKNHKKQIARERSIEYIKNLKDQDKKDKDTGEKRHSGASTTSTAAVTDLGQDELDLLPPGNNTKKASRTARPSLMKTIADIISPTKKNPLASVAVEPKMVPSTLYLTNVTQELGLHEKFLQLTGLAKKSNDTSLNELDKLGNLCIDMLLNDNTEIPEKVLGSPELGAFIFYLMEHPEITCLDLKQIQLPAWDTRTKGMTRSAAKARERRDQFVSDLNQCLELILTYATNIQMVRVTDFASIQTNEDVEHRLALNRQISHDLNVLENNTGIMLLPEAKLVQALSVFKEPKWLEKLIDVHFCQIEAPEACRIMKERKLDLIAQLESYYQHEVIQKGPVSGKILMKQLRTESATEIQPDPKAAKKHQAFLNKIDRTIESSVGVIRAQRMSRQLILADYPNVTSLVKPEK